MNNCIYTHWILFSPKINYEAKQSKQVHVHVDNINRKSGFTYTHHCNCLCGHFTNERQHANKMRKTEQQSV